MPFTIKFSNNETFEKEFIYFYGCASRMPVYNYIFAKIMEAYYNELYDELCGTMFVSKSESDETITFKFNISFEQNKDGEDIYTVEYLGCFEMLEENLSRCEIDF